jgi:hypothetical protein
MIAIEDADRVAGQHWDCRGHGEVHEPGIALWLKESRGLYLPDAAPGWWPAMNSNRRQARSPDMPALSGDITMPNRLPRRDFLAVAPLAAAGTVVGATTTGVPLLADTPQPADAPQAPSQANAIEVRPYQLMCIVCRIGEGRSDDLGDARLTAILAAVRKDRKIPIRLCCNVDTVYRYQNPGTAEDTPEGELFNAKRDLDILQKLGLVPGDARPAVDMLERLLADVPTAKDICGYSAVTGEVWRGCARAESGWYEAGRTLGIDAILPPRDAQEEADFKKTSTAAIYRATTLRIRPHHLMCMSCFYGGRMENLGPIEADNLFEAIDVIQKNPEIPVTLVAGCCMICPPCSHYEPETNLCLGGRGMALRDQKKDLDVLQKLGLKFGDTLPARKLYELLYARIFSTRDICGYGDGEERASEWRICGDPEGNETYRKARAAMLGIES